jgi:hypothetical protein
MKYPPFVVGSMTSTSIFARLLLHELHDVLHPRHSTTLHAIFHMLGQTRHDLRQQVVDHVGGAFRQFLVRQKFNGFKPSTGNTMGGSCEKRVVYGGKMGQNRIKCVVKQGILWGVKPAKLRIINTLIHKMNMFDFSWASGLNPKRRMASANFAFQVY